MINESITTETFNLTNCDREPIHIPGAIQPHGLLLVISPLEWKITQISRNTQEFLGIEPEQLLGQPLDRLLPTDKIEAIAACLEGDFEQINPLKLSIETQNGTKKFNGIVHSLDENNIILELEINKSENDLNFIQFSQISKRILLQIQRASTLNELCQIIVQQIRKLTGFERVMIYQFDQTGAGDIIAEDKLEELESYLGLHYPDSDIPRQAKYLYTLNFIRSIPQVNYQPVTILALDNKQQKPLDLSLSILRSVSPLHIEYLQNMGVCATLTISLMKKGKLWGLIACHHRSPYLVPYETRNICEFLGQVMSLELASKEANEDLDYKIFLKSVQSQLVNALGKAENLTNALIKDREKLLKLVNATGVVIYTEENLIRIGQTPPEEVLPDLIAWLENRFERDLFVTHSLPKIYADAIAFKDVACGLLALSITKVQKNYVLWFRPEVLQEVNWAGKPEKLKILEEDGTETLSPRKSFKLWQEMVQQQSQPWKPWEIEGAIELRSAIVGILLRKINELAEINLELERSNTELDAFAYIASHDLKEPLRGIHNYSNFLLEDYAEPD